MPINRRAPNGCILSASDLDKVERLLRSALLALEALREFPDDRHLLCLISHQARQVLEHMPSEPVARKGAAAIARAAAILAA